MVFVTLNIFCKWAKQRQAALLLRELHLGTKHHLHIYWEHTFLVYNSHHSGVGAGNWGRLAGILSPVMRPLSMNIPGRRKQAIITVLGLNWCCSLPSHMVLNLKRKSKTKTAAGHCFVSWAPWDFHEATKFTENEINLLAQHWSCGDYSLSLTLINAHVPLFALSQCARANYIQAESVEMHCRWSHDKWLYCPVMEIWIIIECLYSDVCTWYDSQWVFC